MSFFKKYWYLILVTVATIGIGVVAYLTSTRLDQAKPVAPTVPQATPKAVDEVNCKLVFSIAADSPTPTLTPTVPVSCNQPCTSNTSCGSGLVCSNGLCRNPVCVTEPSCVCTTPTHTPTLTPTLTPTVPVSCNQPCTSDTSCGSGLVCSNGLCRNPVCVTEASCTCPAPTATLTPTLPPGVPTYTPAPTPRVPISGVGPSVLGFAAIIGGILILLLGVAF